MRVKNDEIFSKIFEEISRNPRVTEQCLAKQMGYSERTIRRYIKILKDKGLINMIGLGKKRKWQIIDKYSI